jgi:putative aminopeptidase FrvX
MPVKIPEITAAQYGLLERLCNASAVSGNEAEVRKIVLAEVQPHADEVQVDALGNVLVTRHASAGKHLRVMLDAHMDEVGFMLVAEEGVGLYRFELVGGIDVRILPGKPVLVGKDHAPGVIGTKPVHILSSDESKHKPELDSLRIDLGPGGRASPGDWGTFATRFRRVGRSMLSKAIDDRIGVAILIELVKKVPPQIELLAAFSVQEEIGLRGATVAGFTFNPDLAIAIDATPAYDLPRYDGQESSFYNTRLGLGPAIYVQNRSTIDDPRLVKFLQETAEAEGILYQMRQPGGGGTDAGAIQQGRTGVSVVSVSVPHRYSHSPVSLARVEDWKHTQALLQAALHRLTPAVIGRG